MVPRDPDPGVCRIGSVDYRVHARLTCVQPDSAFWQELLLVPVGDSPARALASRSARWLAWEPDIGGLLWTPIELPAALVPGEIEQLTRLKHQGREYRRLERDHYQVAGIDGEAGGDVQAGERVQYADLLAGTERLSLEWSGSGLDAYEGRRISAIEIREAFGASGVKLDLRASNDVLPRTPQRAVQAVERYKGTRHDLKDDILGWVIGFAIAVPLVMLENCSADCQRARVNPQTGRTEYVCSDGSVRNSRPWFGK
jgi:hypothetical protein